MTTEHLSGTKFSPLSGLLSAIESLLSRQLDASSAARSKLARLEGKTLALELTGIGLDIYVHCTADGIHLSTEFAEDADVIISGSPLAMLAFARSDAQEGIRGGSVKFTGDIGAAQDFQKLFSTLSPDFEEELSRLIGDEAAYRVGSVFRDALSFGKRAFDQLTQGVSTHLTEGSRDVATETEIDDFLEDVDRLRADVERAEARLNRVQTTTAQD